MFSLSLPQKPSFIYGILVFWVCFLVVGLGLWIYGSLIFLFSLTDRVLENGTSSRSNLKLGLTSTMELYGPVKAANHAKIEDFDTSTRRLEFSGSKSQIFGMVLILYGFGFLVSCGFVCIGKLQGSVGFEGILL